MNIKRYELLKRKELLGYLKVQNLKGYVSYLDVNEIYNLINKVNLYIKFTKIYKEFFIVKVKIHPNTLDKVKDMLDNSDKDALRIKACSSGWAGLNIEVVLDEQRENDDVVMDNGIKIVADKKISHFFTDATLEYKNTILGKKFKIY